MMNIDQVLQYVQDFRSQLEVWGVTSETLWFAGAAAAILFILSLREVACWYFRINQVREEVTELREQMHALRRTMEETNDWLTNNPKAKRAASAKTASPSKPEEEGTAALFRFDN